MAKKRHRRGEEEEEEVKELVEEQVEISEEGEEDTKARNNGDDEEKGGDDSIKGDNDDDDDDDVEKESKRRRKEEEEEESKQEQQQQEEEEQEDSEYSDIEDESKDRGREEQDSQYEEDDHETSFSGRAMVPQEQHPKNPVKSIEGWVVFVRNLHEEAQDEDVHDLFAEYGDITSLHLNLDRRTGFVKGYAVIEYVTKEDAQEAIKEMNGRAWRERTLEVDWAFVEAPPGARGVSAKHMAYRQRRGRGNRGSGADARNRRPPSPERRDHY